MNRYINTKSENGTFTVDIKISEKLRNVGTYYEETKMALSEAWDNKLGKVYLFYSGGKDSEYILNTMRFMGLDVTPIIILTQYNRHDTQYAIDFCNSFNIIPLIFEEDYDKFVASSTFVDFINENPLIPYHNIINMHIAKKIDGTIIFGTGNPQLKKCLDNGWYSYFHELVYSHLSFFKKHMLHGNPFVLSRTPEQYLSFLLEPTISDLTSDRIFGKLASESSKIHVYNNQSDFKLVDRPKFHGYESVEKSLIFNHENFVLARNSPGEWRACFFEVHDIVNLLSGPPSLISRTNVPLESMIVNYEPYRNMSPNQR